MFTGLCRTRSDDAQAAAKPSACRTASGGQGHWAGTGPSSVGWKGLALHAMNSTLGYKDRRLLEDVLQMRGGYVLDFLDRTFREFVEDAVGRNIDDPRYSTGGTSKANRLRTFWNIEPPRVVATLLMRLLQHAEETSTECDAAQLARCRDIAARLSAAAQVEEPLATLHEDTTLQALSESVNQELRANKPGNALDRLHTYTVRFLSRTCEANSLPVTENDTANGLLGKYCKHIERTASLEAAMSVKILKYAISVFEAFNSVRNDKSLAHPNPVLNAREALLVCNYVILTLNFIDSHERDRRQQARADPDPVSPDDIPF